MVANVPTEVIERHWDVIVIGAGLGGGTIGRRLAERGLSVLFVERGPSDRGIEKLDGEPPCDDRYWEPPLKARLNGVKTEIPHAVASCVGGSSAFYAATLERPERHDIDDSCERRHPTGGWPVRYDHYLPYFGKVEQLFHVCGAKDPLSAEDDAGQLRTPPPLTGGDAEMFASFRACGLHPYRLHMGVDFQPGCGMCFGKQCHRKCKMDGRSAGVEPALATGRADLLDLCDVIALRGGGGRVAFIEAVREGQRIKLFADRFVLAGGALGSPRLLLASKSDEWPDGCANSSGLVGRNLMFHLQESLAIWPRRGAKFPDMAKAIGMRDFYYRDGARYGALQAAGLEATYGTLVHRLKAMFDRSTFRKLRPFRHLTRVPAYLATKLFGDGKVYRSFIEDFPYASNRVLLDDESPARIRIEYDVPVELEDRRRQFRRLVKSKLRRRSLFLNDGPELNYAHACGTLRFGDNPATSVLNRDCRAHDLQNLYVADASFMPTSTGINPSLLIAANALRVADRMLSDSVGRATDTGARSEPMCWAS